MRKIIFILLCIILLSGCQSTTEITGFSMDAPYSIKLKGIEKTREINALMKNADSIFSRFDASYLSTLNKEKSILKTDDNEDLFNIINKSRSYFGDYFDISIGEYTKLWDFNSKIAPTDEELSKAQVGFDNIVYSENEIKLLNNISVDLGAVAKGYMCDKIYDIIDGEAVLNIGGTVKSSLKKPLPVTIRNNSEEQIYFYLNKSEAVATSGSYERNFYKDGKFYHHILNPKTGKSVETDIKSVTVISESALKSDILSTYYFVSGSDADVPDDISVIFITNQNEIIKKGKELPIYYK